MIRTEVRPQPQTETSSFAADTSLCKCGASQHEAEFWTDGCGHTIGTCRCGRKFVVRPRYLQAIGQARLISRTRRQGCCLDCKTPFTYRGMGKVPDRCSVCQPCHKRAGDIARNKATRARITKAMQRKIA